MNGHSTYEAFRHFADSWGLLGMAVAFVLLCAWAFRPGSGKANEKAANMIFAEDDYRGNDHGE